MTTEEEREDRILEEAGKPLTDYIEGFRDGKSQATKEILEEVEKIIDKLQREIEIEWNKEKCTKEQALMGIGILEVLRNNIKDIKQLKKLGEEEK